MKLRKLSFLFCLSILLFSCATTKAPEAKSEKSGRLKSKYKVVSINDKFNYLESDIKYPQFDDYSVLNNLIKNTVENYYNSFKMYAESDWNELYKMRSKTDDNLKLLPFEYKVSFQLSETEKYISVLFRTFVYNGGNHGSTTLFSYNFDKAKNKLVNITEATGFSYKELSKYCNSVLVEKLLKESDKNMSKDEIVEWVNEGTFPTPDNYEIFMIHENYVVVFFEEYTVAPYVYGEQSVKVPLFLK